MRTRTRAACTRSTVQRGRQQELPCPSEEATLASEGEEEGNELPSASTLEARFGLFTLSEDSQHALCPAENGTMACACARCSTWAAFISSGGYPRGRRQFEVLTSELAFSLARCLCVLRVALKLGEERPLRVLELGAGSGRLAHHVRKALGRMSAAGAGSSPDERKVLLIASDIASTRTSADLDAAGAGPDYPLLLADYRAALEQCRPDVALVCWMPLGSDWTPSIRACPSVQAYLLVGETSGVVCGSPGTWGRARAEDEQGALPPEVGGWTVRALEGTSARQLCMLDEPWDNTRHSQTVLFLREANVVLESEANVVLESLRQY